MVFGTILLGLFTISSPASAQVGATVSVETDYRFRARSLSAGRPVTTVALSYDDRSGAYAGAAVTGLLTGKNAGGVVSQQFYVGYARPASSVVTIDIGVSAYRYTSLYSARQRELFAEGYVGATSKDLSAYVRVSPSYYGRGGPVVYLDVAANREIARALRIYARAGLLLQASGMPRLGGRRSRHDVQAGLSREFGRIAIKAEVAIGGPDDAYFAGIWRGRSSLTFGVQRSF